MTPPSPYDVDTSPSEWGGSDLALAEQQPELAVEYLQHVLEIVAVGELARPVVDHVAALGGVGHLGDREQRLLGGVAEDRGDRHAGTKIDGGVAPFAPGEPHT